MDIKKIKPISKTILNMGKQEKNVVIPPLKGNPPIKGKSFADILKDVQKKENLELRQFILENVVTESELSRKIVKKAMKTAGPKVTRKAQVVRKAVTGKVLRKWPEIYRATYGATRG